MPPLKRISIGGYRAVSELDFEPRSVCALVGEASSGKSTVLTAIWTLLEAAAPPPTIDDVSRVTSGGRIHLEADVERGRTIFLDAHPPDTLNLNRAGAPPVLFLPANLRSRSLVAPAMGAGAADVAQLFAPPLAAHHWAAADGGLQLVMGMERLLASNLRRFVLLIEEPELYLSPHAQRHLFRVLRSLARQGNQILYSTHAPVFLTVDRMEELALVRHHTTRGTTLFQPEPLAEAEAFRVLSEFDSERAVFRMSSCMTATQSSSEMSIPIAVSLTDTLASSFCRWMRSRMSRYAFADARASRSFVTLSPSRSSDAEIPLAFKVRTATSASSRVSPATNRDANFFASLLFRTNRKTRG